MLKVLGMGQGRMSADDIVPTLEEAFSQEGRLGDSPRRLRREPQVTARLGNIVMPIWAGTVQLLSRGLPIRKGAIGALPWSC